METMRSLERTGENIVAFEVTRERRDQAMLDFERITGMSSLDFMLRAPAEGGIDRDQNDDEQTVLEYIYDVCAQPASGIGIYQRS